LSAAARGALGGLLAGFLFTCAGIMGGGTTQAQMYGVVIVLPAMLLVGALLGLAVGAAWSMIARRRRFSRWFGAPAGLVLGAVVGAGFDLAVHREIDLQHGMLIIAAWVGLLAGSFAARARPVDE
jgi:hypothetical protein